MNTTFLAYGIALAAMSALLIVGAFHQGFLRVVQTIGGVVSSVQGVANRRLIEFTPTAIQKIQDADGQDLYDIYGKATMCEMGELIKKSRVAITARLQDGKWYFSTVGDILID